MTASQRTLTPGAMHGRAAGIAVATAFAVGLASGLVVPRLASLTTPSEGSVATVRANGAPVDAIPATGAGPIVAGGSAVKPYAGSMADLPLDGRFINPQTGFTIGPLVRSPAVNTHTGFVVGVELRQASPWSDTASTSTAAAP